MTRPLDATDLRLLAALSDEPRAGHSDLARRVGVSRGTVYTRLERLERDGVIDSYEPTIDPVGAGFGVLAFTTLEISQGSHDATIAALAEIVEVLEVHTVTGPGDLLCRIIARSNAHLHEVLQQVTGIPTVRRSTSQLALSTSHRRSVLALVIAD